MTVLIFLMQICSIICKASREHRFEHGAFSEISRLYQSRFLVEYINSGISKYCRYELRTKIIIFSVHGSMKKYTEHSKEIITISLRMLLESYQFPLYVVILSFCHIELVHCTSGFFMLAKYTLLYILTDEPTVKRVVHTSSCKTVHFIETDIKSQRCVTIWFPGKQLYQI